MARLAKMSILQHQTIFLLDHTRDREIREVYLDLLRDVVNGHMKRRFWSRAIYMADPKVEAEILMLESNLVPAIPGTLKSLQAIAADRVLRKVESHAKP